MEHCMLAKKTIKKIEKNNTKQVTLLTIYMGLITAVRSPKNLSG